jgi:CYTH domain-containing protein
MSITRRFLLASSLARLLEKERGGRHVTEGYFPDRHEQSIHVRVEEGTGALILVTHGSRGPVEVPADLPRAQAEALLGLVAGRIEYRRIDLSIGAHNAHLSRVMASEPLDIIAVELDEEQARAFQPPSWFGPEVTADPIYQSRSLALAGLSAAAEVELTDDALNSLLDTLESGLASSRLPAEASTAAAPPATDTDDAEDLGIEDSVIRELARSLRPKNR